MRIITISREFGSGGRELGKRLADLLAFDYYDGEILAAIAKNRGLNEHYVEQMLNTHGWSGVPLRFGRSLSAPNPGNAGMVGLLVEQKNVIAEIGRAGKDCVIVGRNADVLLAEHEPLKLFVCADMPARLARCRSRAPEDENLTEKQLARKIREIDRSRARSREVIGAAPWGRRDIYHLTVNTGGWAMRELAPAVAEFARAYFALQEKGNG